MFWFLSRSGILLMIVVTYHWSTTYSSCLTFYVWLPLLNDVTTRHLSFGEMTITLDDVSSMFHLSSPVDSSLLLLLIRSLHLSRLYMIWDLLRRTYEATSCVYMLHLVAWTIFVDKSHIYIDAQYMWLFSNLDHASWAWGCTVLIAIYAVLRGATTFDAT